MGKSVKLYLVRHALPLVASGVCYGASDLPADSQASQQAAQALAKVLPAGLELLCSPLQRCRQLAECLMALRPDLSLRLDTRLAEMDFGAWEGQPWAAIAVSELTAWTDNFRHWRCGGAESVEQVLLRVSAALKDTRNSGRTAVWITHAGVIRAANLILSGQADIERADQWPRSAPGWGECLETEIFCGL